MKTRMMNNSAAMTISSPARTSVAVVSFAFINAARFFSVLRFYFYYFFSYLNTSERCMSF